MARKSADKLLTTIPDSYEANFVDRLDRRTRLARVVTERINAIETDLGGADGLTHARKSLVRRATWLECVVETYEQNLAAGNMIDLGAYTQSINSLLGLYRLLGMERKAKPVKRLRDHLGAQ